MNYKAHIPQIVLSVVFIVGYFALLFFILSGAVTIPESLASEPNIIIGVITASVTNIFNYWFGSSSGSKDKTLIMKGDAHE
jgi:hypothetical protein